MNQTLWQLTLGANFTENNKVMFKVWAPFCKNLKLSFKNNQAYKEPVALDKEDQGYFYAKLSNLKPGDQYFYVLDNGVMRPDPVSRFLPEGPHGSTSIINPDSFKWTDSNWKGIALKDYVIYELHVGTFTKQGNFISIAERLSYLKEIGITCIEIMPVAQFPGKHNWGYDGVSLYAVQNNYGGPDQFKKFINECHHAGLAICLDVVYNHLGPEGNYLGEFGPYFTDRYSTPWGKAINYDGAYSNHVRDYIIQNALYWIKEYHVDALRLDAVHGIYDFSARHILEELNDAVEAEAILSGRQIHLFAESDLNDTKIIKPKSLGGYGLAAQWSDDFHHSVHAFLTGEMNGYYEDFSKIGDIAKAFSDRFVYDGKYSKFRKRNHGNSARDYSGEHFIVSIQNHDQVGNRAQGDRLSNLLSFELQKLATTLLILSPFIPLLFMGEEYGETSPFLYFIDHGDSNLVEAVREGRKKEFMDFKWRTISDPAAETTFVNSKLQWLLWNHEYINNYKSSRHQFTFNLYKDLLKLRKKILSPEDFQGGGTKVFFDEKNKWLILKYKLGLLVYSFAKKSQIIDLSKIDNLEIKNGQFKEVFCSEYERYGGGIKKMEKDLQTSLNVYAESIIVFL